MGPTDDPSIFLASTHFDPREEFPEPILERFLRPGDGWWPLSISPEMYAAGANRLRASVKDIERDPTDIEFLYYQASVTDESAQSAFEAAQRFLRGYYPWPLSVEEIRNRGAFGPPETTIDHIQAYVDAGVETFVTRFPTRDQHGRLRRYAEFIEAMG